MWRREIEALATMSGEGLTDQVIDEEKGDYSPLDVIQNLQRPRLRLVV